MRRRIHVRHRRNAPSYLASAWGALCRLSATGQRCGSVAPVSWKDRAIAWRLRWGLWLVRSPAPGGFAAKLIESGEFAPGAAAPLGVVLLDRLPGLVVALGAEVVRHG